MSNQAANNTFSTPNNTVGNLNGFFKETYADMLENLIPDGVKLLNRIKFLAKDKQPGNLYHQPVILGMENGITFAASDQDAFNLLAPVAGSIKDAQVRGNPVVLQSVLGYTAASRAEGSQAAFESATKYLVANMLRSMARALEVEMFYGQVGYGTVASLGGSGNTVITITTAEWAPGIWAGAEGMPIEIRSADGATSRGNFVLASVNMSARTITVDSNPVSVIATDVIWRKGAYGNEFPGVHYILTLSSGTLFNINVGQYALFRGNQYSANSGALSFTKLTNAAALAVEKGQDGKLYTLCNPRAWANMLQDQAALRKYDGSYSVEQLKNGSKSLRFYSQNGEIEIEPSIFVKEGYCYMLSLEDWNRVGSSDMTFKVPGQSGEEFFRHLESAAGYQLRLWSDQAVFCSAVGRNVILTSVVNSF